MKKLFNEDGSINEIGKSLLNSTKKDIESLFDTLTVSDLSDTQLRLLGSWLNKLVGDEVADKLAQRGIK